VAHAPDPALSRAIGAAIRELRAQGWSTQDLADRLDVATSSISRWENGGRLPALDLLPRFDALLDRPRGEVLRRAGYVADDLGEVDVVAVIRADRWLTSEQKLTLTDVYESMSRRAQAAASA